MRKECVLHGYRVGQGAQKEAERTLPLILSTELLKLLGLQWTGRLLLVQQSQAVNALLHHGYLCIWETRGEERRVSEELREEGRARSKHPIQGKGKMEARTEPVSRSAWQAQGQQRAHTSDKAHCSLEGNPRCCPLIHICCVPAPTPLGEELAVLSQLQLQLISIISFIRKLLLQPSHLELWGLQDVTHGGGWRS